MLSCSTFATLLACAFGLPGELPVDPSTPESLFPALQAPHSNGSKDGGAYLALMLGQRTLDDSSTWNGIDEPTSFGFDYASSAVGPGFELGLQFAQDSADAGDVDFGGVILDAEIFSRFVECSAGIRVGLPVGNKMGLYAGAGLTYIFAEAETVLGGVLTDGGVDDSSLAQYGHAGAYARLGTNAFIGIDYRIVTGSELEFDFPGGTVETDADYSQLAVTFGVLP